MVISLSQQNWHWICYSKKYNRIKIITNLICKLHGTSHSIFHPLITSCCCKGRIIRFPPQILAASSFQFFCNVSLLFSPFLFLSRFPQNPFVASLSLSVDPWILWVRFNHVCFSDLKKLTLKFEDNRCRRFMSVYRTVSGVSAWRLIEHQSGQPLASILYSSLSSKSSVNLFWSYKYTLSVITVICRTFYECVVWNNSLYAQRCEWIDIFRL